jgi:uncharacterized protein
MAAKAIQCPTCKREVDADGRYFPFCSERCRLIDLGRWLDGKYQVAVEEPDEADDAARGPGARRLDDDDGG